MKEKLTFYICLGITLALLVGGFIVPPTGVIDGSVLSAAGILFAFAAMSQVSNLIRQGKDIKIKHGSTEVAIDD